MLEHLGKIMGSGRGQSDKTVARVIGDSLVISLPKAVKPAVWRRKIVDMNDMSFELADKENGIHLDCLVGKERIAIAVFADKAHADEAFNAISRAMLYAAPVNQNVSQAEMASGEDADGQASSEGGIFKKLVLWAAAVAALYLLFSWFFYGGVQFGGSDHAKTEQQASRDTAQNVKPVIEDGVPVSADQLLGQTGGN